MVLSSEYQYIGRSNEIKDQNNYQGYYLLMYAKSSGDLATGIHRVYVKQRLVSTSTNRFYGWSTSGNIVINGSEVVTWSWQNVPASDWNSSSLTEGGHSYPCWVDLKEGILDINVGYGATKDITISATWTFLDGVASYLPQKYVTAEVSGSVTLPMLAGASQPSVSTSSADLESKVTIKTNRITGSGLKHTLTYKFGNASGTIAENVEDSHDWYPALNLAQQIPNSVSGTCTIYCETFAQGTSIGKNQVTVTLVVPSSVKPAVSATWEDKTNAFSLVGALVQGISALKITYAAAGAQGSTIASVTSTIDNKAYSGGTLYTAGTLTLKVTALDSRGRSNAVTYNVVVAEYSVPSLNLNASRCTADGTADDNGDHAIITVTGFVTQVNSQNTATLKVNWSMGSESIDPSVGDIEWQKIVYADVNSTLTITAELSDKLVKATRSMVLSTGYATLDLLAGGKGISFGKAATIEGFDCAMPTYFRAGAFEIHDDGTIDTKSLFDRVAALEAILGV